MNQELLRIIDSVSREKNIDRTTMLEDLEAAILSAVKKANADSEEVVVRIDPQTGDITAEVDGRPMSMRMLGRIAAQTAKQVMIQRIREAERGSIYEEYVQRKGQIVTGKTARWEGGSLVVELGRIDAFLPRAEQIPGESHGMEERLRAMVLDVREQPNQVRIILSRTHPDFIRALFELEVPEVAEEIIEIRAMAREAGYRTKVAVNSLDSKVDAVGACVGIRGSRIKNIVDELGGEKIDIVRWNDSSKVLIANSLKPAEIAEVSLCFELGRAIVVVTEDQLSLAIGKRGQNVRLAARLTGWDIDILTPTEFNVALDTLEKALREVEGVDSKIIEQVIAIGMVNVMDVEEVGAGPLVKELGMDQALADAIVARASKEAKAVVARNAEEARIKAEEKAAPAEAPTETETSNVDESPAVDETPEADIPEAPSDDVPSVEETPSPEASEPEAPEAESSEEEQERPNDAT